VGLQKNRLTDIDKIPDAVGTAANYQMAKKIAARCLTLAKDESKLVPLRPSQKVLVLTMSNKEGNSMVSRGLVSFPEELRKFSPSAKELRLSDSLRTDEMNKALDLAKESDVVVVAAYIKIVLSSGTVDLPPAHAAFLQQLVKQNPRVVLVSFGNPYIGGSVPEIPVYICAYDNAKALQEATAEALSGKTKFSGKLPVTISETMKFGTGLRK
jgi:beta-N-acetylhexosaminidase